MGRFRSIFCKEGSPIEHFNVLTKRSYGISFLCLSTKLQKAEPNMGSTDHKLRQVRKNGEATQSWETVLTKRERLEKKEKLLVLIWMWL